MLVTILREKFWILRARRTVRNIIQNFVKCKRYNAGPVKSESASLPADRVRDAVVFEVIGIDLAGPLLLKSGEKVWVVLYTCKVYRAVHLELVTAMSTNNFLLSLRRFIARRGRPSAVYTDSGTNFRGAVREFKNLDWIKIERETQIPHIKWKFNPPTAAWWGGWWKRLIRVLKDLLKRTLGNAVLTYEELLTVLCDCESIVSSRPLTYVSEDSDDLIPLTPAMFMMSNASLDMTDLDLSDFARFQKRGKFRARLLKDLRGMCRKEYLVLLVQKGHKTTRALKVGEIVLIENPNKKRLYWPLGKVIQLIPGRDGKVRTLKLRCSNSEIIRPIQRVFPLEIQSAEIKESNDVPLDAKALKIPSASIDVSESAMIPVNSPPNMPKVSR
ncbi:integrase catalytic domain-containing protein [Trichonephila clavipes]|uniref:Integrase catalytic domain-containing protein n=1 Tax=Trichonephila clavipes TaxID=2585209 RepID=A0A8X6SYA3_TRICX|nr:integrase catalytic domain-containing protein [Trichonephila clavipes]